MKIMSVNEYFEKYYYAFLAEDGGIEHIRRPRARMADGFEVGIRANKYGYCKPREDILAGFTEVELGFPSDDDELISEYAEYDGSFTPIIYPYVPVEIVDKLIEKHGGIVEAMALDEIVKTARIPKHDYIFSWEDNKDEGC